MSKIERPGMGAPGYALVTAFFIVSVITIMSLLGNSISTTMTNFVDALPVLGD